MVMELNRQFNSSQTLFNCWQKCPICWYHLHIRFIIQLSSRWLFTGIYAFLVKSKEYYPIDFISFHFTLFNLDAMLNCKFYLKFQNDRNECRSTVNKEFYHKLSSSDSFHVKFGISLAAQCKPIKCYYFAIEIVRYE